MRTVQVTRSSTVTASGARGRSRKLPTGLYAGWRNRARHRPELGGGGGSRGSGPAQAGPVVLLVDDERAIRTICRVNLEGDGISVLEAADADEALVHLGQESPSLVLLDVMLPGIDGWRVAEQLAGDPATQDIPVVFLSARATQEDVLRARELGAVGYIMKPFDPLELAGVIRSVIERVGRGERGQLNRELIPGE